MGLFDIFTSFLHPTNKILNITSQDNKDKSLPINLSNALPTQTKDFKEQHIKVLYKLNNHPIDEPFTGIVTKEVDIPNFIPILIELDLIKVATCTESLSLLKAENLKQILKDNNLKISGKKADLVKRILDNIDESLIKTSDAYLSFYKLTPSGEKLIDDIYAASESERIAFFKNIIDQILNFNLNGAYRMVCKRNAEMPISPGLGCNWHNRYQTGLSEKDEQIYLQRLQNSTEILTTAIAIYYEMSGEKAHDIDNWIPKAFPDIQLSKLDFRTEACTISISKELKDMVDCEIKKYQFVATLDDETCPICGKLDGKRFLVSNANIGVNCPPIHKGCRCTIISCSTYQENPHHRRARNRLTGKTELVSGNITYTQWKNDGVTNAKKS